MQRPRVALAPLLALLAFVPDASAQRRPFHVIAHGCNDARKVAVALLEGANAIECDVAAEGRRLFVDHPSLLFGRVETDTPLVGYLRVLRRLAARSPALTLVIFDCKFGDPALADPLLDTIRTHLTNGTSLRVMISVADWEDRGFFTPILNRLRANEGVAIDEHNSPSRVSNFFTARGVRNFAYGNGTAVPVNIYRSITEAVALQARLGRIGMVYPWTINDRDDMIDYLRIGVDGIMTDDVRRLRTLVLGSEFRRKVRLATRRDNPWDPTPVPAYVLNVRTSRTGGAGTDAYLTFSVRGSRALVSTTINTDRTGLFETGAIDEVTLRGTDVGRVMAISVCRDNSRNRPNWRVDDITLRTAGRPAVHRFRFNQWIPAYRQVTRTPGHARYRLTVRTTSGNGGGTDANVHFVVVGSVGALSRTVDGGRGPARTFHFNTRVRGPEVRR